MPEAARLKDEYYIIAATSAIDREKLTIKYGDTFGVFDHFGDILPMGQHEQGIYHESTRFLSRYEFKLQNKRALFLSSNVDEDNILVTVDLTNPDFYKDDTILLKRDFIHIMRSRMLLSGHCVEHIRLKNFSTDIVTLQAGFIFGADFADIFEVRGMKRRERGEVLPPVCQKDSIAFSYIGLDHVKRTTLIRFSEPPDHCGKEAVQFIASLAPNEMKSLYIQIDCLLNDAAPSELINFQDAYRTARSKMHFFKDGCVRIHTSNDQFNETITRSLADIGMLITETDYGLYPYAGIPWYSTVFGRDGITTALECLWINPDVAKGVLNYLSATQATETNERMASEPGKILHETRKGEMAALKEIPFGLYYGSVDSTPLFLILAGQYLKRTGDMEFIKSIWPNIERALAWMETYGDVDKDGFIEYVPGKIGLRNQGWKDSADSIFHRDGTFAEGPIALCEVQGYQYAAKKEISRIARLLGKHDLADRLSKEADLLRDLFDTHFWDDELRTYVLALDGNKKPCRVLSSNAGHALFSGIAYPERAKILGRVLTSEPMFSGWGIRTIASDEYRYNPISYHNGSIWPHDNAMIGYGLAYYGLKHSFYKVFSKLFDASLHMELHRLTELFCGFHKRHGQAPTLYPVACSPQAWASGAFLLLLQAAFGLEFNIEEKQLIFDKPMFPEFLQTVSLRDLQITEGRSIDLTLQRYKDDVSVDVLRKPADLEVVIRK